MNRPQLDMIREVEPSDLDDLLRLFEENNRSEITKRFHPFPLTPEMAQFICAVPKKDRYYVAYYQGELVGLGMLRGWDEGYDIPAFGAFIDYRHHTKGFGGTIGDHAIAEARRIGSPAVRISGHVSNPVIHHYCSTRGFTLLSKDPIELDGKPDFKVVWQLDLADE